MRAGTLARRLSAAWPLAPAAGGHVPASAGEDMPAPPGLQQLPSRPTRLSLVPALVRNEQPAGRQTRALHGLTFVALVVLTVAV